MNILGSISLNTGNTALVLNTPAIYGVGTSGDTATIDAASFTWNGVATQSTGSTRLNVSATPGGQTAAGLVSASSLLAINAGTILLGYGPQTQPNPQLELDRLVSGFGTVALNAGSEITANAKGALSVYATYDPAMQTFSGGVLQLNTPLLTTASAAVLKLTAGDSLTIAPPAKPLPSATAGLTAQGGEIDLAASSIAVSTSIALPAGRLVAIASGAIDLASGAGIDLAGRTAHIFDRTVFTPGGALSLESSAGSIALERGSRIDVSSPGNAAGSVSLNALAGAATLDGTLLGGAAAGQTGGSFTVLAGTLASSSSSTLLAAGASAFDTVNEGLNAGGFSASRSFEFSADIGPQGTRRTDLAIGNDAAGNPILAAHSISVTNDAGAIDITGTIDASGTGPGSLTLDAKGNLTLEAGARLDAHATTTATDSTGAPIDAENRAHVTLSTIAGSLTLLGGSIDLSYPGSVASPQGQLVLDAPRVGTGDVAITASAPIAVTGAQSIALYGWTSYAPADAAGTIKQTAQGAGHGLGNQLVSINQIDTDNAAFMASAGANAALAGRLAGLASYGAVFHLRPGVEIDSNSSGTLTISGDLNLAGLRYSDAGYGTAVTAGQPGSGEPGAILFRAANKLIVNGSVSDGFAVPPDAKSSTAVPGDNGWVFLSRANSPTPDPLNADIILPSSIQVVDSTGKITQGVRLGVGTTFDATRAISLNYAITIDTAPIGPGTVIPFAVKLGAGHRGTGRRLHRHRGDRLVRRHLPRGCAGPGGHDHPGRQHAERGQRFACGHTGGDQHDGARGHIAVHLRRPDPDPDAGNHSFARRRLPAVQHRAGVRDESRRHRQCAGAAPAIHRPGRQHGAGLPVSAGRDAARRHAVLEHELRGRCQYRQRQPQRRAAAQRSRQPSRRFRQHPLSGARQPDPRRPALSAGLYKFRRRHAVARLQRDPHGHRRPVAGRRRQFRPELALRHLYRRHPGPAAAGGDAASAAYDIGRQGVRNGQVFAAGNAESAARSSAHIPGLLSEQWRRRAVGRAGQCDRRPAGPPLGGGGTPLGPSDAIGNWLWRQGSAALGQPTAWWINFGTLGAAYRPTYRHRPAVFRQRALPVQMVGFQGIGALGGGNVVVNYRRPMPAR